MADKQQTPRRVLVVSGGAAAAVVGVFIIVISAILFSRGLPSVEQLKDYPYKRVSEVYSEDGSKIGEFYRERRYVIPFNRIPDVVKGALLAAEDAEFFQHSGIDYVALLRATLVNVFSASARQGASTITMQAAKVAMLTPEKKLSRKVRQIILAKRMEENLSKEEILGLYLNLVFFGRQAYGIEAAARAYFGKSAQDLTPAEAAMLAALPKAPSRMSQPEHRARWIERQQWILKQWKGRISQWRKQGLDFGITEADLDAALAEADHVIPAEDPYKDVAPYLVEQIRREVQERFGEKAVYEGGLRIYTTAHAAASREATRSVRAGLRALDKRQGYRGVLKHIDGKDEREAWIREHTPAVAEALQPGKDYEALVLKVNQKSQRALVSIGHKKGLLLKRDMLWARTPNFQVNWESALVKDIGKVLKEGDVILVAPKGELTAEDTKSKEYDDKVTYFVLEQEPLVQGALLAMDPHTGAVRAMVGGYDFSKSEYNRATQAWRQPGSAFKPFVYAAAIDKGYTPSTIIVDSPIVFAEDTTVANKLKPSADADDEDDLTWKPKNYGSEYSGDTTLRTALVLSRNIVTIKILQDIGIRYASWYVRNLGMTREPTQDLSMGLGSSDATLWDMVQAFSVFPGLGKKATPFFVRSVVDRNGHALEWDAPRQGVFRDSEDVLREAEKRALGTPRVQTAFAHALAAGDAPKVPPEEADILSGKGLPPGNVISPQTAYVMTGLLRDVVRSGTATRAAALGRPAGGKTGTTNDEYDAWFLGFTPSLVAGVWVGFDQKQPLGRGETGGHSAVPIWLDFMTEAVRGTPAVDFPAPDGIVFQRIDRESGLLACPNTPDPVFVAYKEETEPKEFVCRRGYSPMNGLTPTNAPRGMPPTGVPAGLPPE